MLLTFLPVLLILKHFLIANVVDIGYSNARDRRQPGWFWDMLLWTGVEVVASYCLYLSAGLRKDKYLILAELTLCLASVFCERRARLGCELRTYFGWETAFFLFYVMIGLYT